MKQTFNEKREALKAILSGNRKAFKELKEKNTKKGKIMFATQKEDHSWEIVSHPYFPALIRNGSNVYTVTDEQYKKLVEKYGEPFMEMSLEAVRETEKLHEENQKIIAKWSEKYK